MPLQEGRVQGRLQPAGEQHPGPDRARGRPSRYAGERSQQGRKKCSPRRAALPASPGRAQAHALKQGWVLHRQQHHLAQLAHNVICARKQTNRNNRIQPAAVKADASCSSGRNTPGNGAHSVAGCSQRLQGQTLASPPAPSTQPCGPWPQPHCLTQPCHGRKVRGSNAAHSSGLNRQLLRGLWGRCLLRAWATAGQRLACRGAWEAGRVQRMSAETARCCTWRLHACSSSSSVVHAMCITGGTGSSGPCRQQAA